MSWSMDSISFRMAGSGSWQYLLSDDFSKNFYSTIYPFGIDISQLDSKQQKLIFSWQDADIIKIENNRAITMGPVMTDSDLGILEKWFDEISSSMCNSIKRYLSDYRLLASEMIGDSSSERYNNLLTIMVCAHTLDSTVFSHLRNSVMGTYIPRGAAGTFYFWGYGFSKGPQRIFGFTSYGGYGNAAIHVIRSHGLDREKLKQVLQQRDTALLIYDKFIGPALNIQPAPNLSNLSEEDKRHIQILQNVHLMDPDTLTELSIPAFYGEDMRKASDIYLKASTIITHNFMDNMDMLGDLVKQCSFAHCPSADVLCMLFHLAYSYAADTLVEEGIIAEFPERAGGEWGVWIH